MPRLPEIKKYIYLTFMTTSIYLLNHNIWEKINLNSNNNNNNNN